jgi:hypothetical protein
LKLLHNIRILENKSNIFKINISIFLKIYLPNIS